MTIEGSLFPNQYTFIHKSRMYVILEIENKKEERKLRFGILALQVFAFFQYLDCIYFCSFSLKKIDILVFNFKT